MKSTFLKLGLLILVVLVISCSDLLTAPEENENNRPTSTFSFGLDENTYVHLYVTNYNFEFVKTIFEGELNYGNFAFSWDGTDYNGDQIASGIYYYFLMTNDYFSGKQMILIK